MSWIAKRIAHHMLRSIGGERDVRSSRMGKSRFTIPRLGKRNVQRGAYVRSPNCWHMSSARSVDQPRGTDERENGTDERRNEREWEWRDSERRRMRREEDGRKEDHLRLTMRAQRIFQRRCTFVPPLYFGSKNAATRPIVTRECRATRLFFPFLIPSLPLSLRFSSFSR